MNFSIGSLASGYFHWVGSLLLMLTFSACLDIESRNVIAEKQNEKVHLSLVDSETEEICPRDSIVGLREGDTEPQPGENRIQCFQNDRTDLFAFFCKLENAASVRQKVRILYYGDSQILRDRGTRQLRDALQQKFGGSGPGLQHIGRYYPYLDHWTLDCKSSDNWVFYDAFLFPDKKVPHKRYGMMSVFSRFADIVDSSYAIRKAWVEYSPSKHAYPGCRSWRTMSLYYGNVKDVVGIKLYVNDSLVKRDSLPVSDSISSYAFDFGREISNLRIEFISESSPDFYGIRFDGESGLMLDNIGLCGSAGTFFTSIHPREQSFMFSDMGPDMIVLQFGGNTVPATKSKTSVDRYCRIIEKQIRFLQKLNPDIPILVAGPSDMQYMYEDSLWYTYPYLEKIIIGMKAACKSTGAYYWDIYNVMGGKGAMKNWYDEGFVREDRIHFNTKGINRIMEMLEEALLEQYQYYSKLNKEI